MSKLNEYLEKAYTERMEGAIAPGASSKEFTKGSGQAGATQNTQVEYSNGKFYKVESGKPVEVQLPATVVDKFKKAVEATGLSMDDINKWKIPPMDFFIHSNGTIELKQKEKE